MSTTSGFLKYAHNAALLLVIFASAGWLISCGTTTGGAEERAPEVSTTASAAQPDPDLQAGETTESWIILDGEPRYLRPRTWNLHHQAARLAFDFEEEAVIGSTELLFTNKRNVSETLILDSKTTELHSVNLSGSDEQLTFRQDSAIVTIDLDKKFSRGDTLSITIDFTSFPPRRGLYFVDPRAENPTKPTQVWTLGQPEDNSFWLPTIDHPAERATQEFWITVPDSMTTMSNGFLISQTDNPDTGERTDYWKLDIPHAPYLFAIAAGVYDVTERWVDDIYYAYYTEPRFSEYTELIYDQTEEMVAWFGEKFGYAYPWGAYMQAPVHEYIARGMENTTATILYDLVQVDERAAQDVSHLALIIHEVVHQWFGNVVTCKDWANLPFNEGLANYFETLYKRDHLGYEAARWHSLKHKEDYFTEAESYRRPVIFNRYTEPEDMYDRHTYAKAGQILGMLHEYTGEETWWAALNNFLHTFEYQAVDMRDVQHIFEQETGENLNWFFDQWFYEPGHPEINVAVQQQENEGVHTADITITQVHNTELQPVFRLETEPEIITENGSHHKKIILDDITKSISVELDSPLVDVIPDPAGTQLAVFRQNLTTEQLAGRFSHEEPAVRYYAILYAEENGLADELTGPLLEMIGGDSLHPLRAEALRILGETQDEDVFAAALDVRYENQPNYKTRREALRYLANFSEMDEDAVRDRLREAVSDTSYFVSAEAIRLYAAKGYDDALEVISPYYNSWSWNELIRSAVAEGLQQIGSEEALELLMKMAASPGDFGFKADALEHLAGLSWTEHKKGDAVDLFAKTLRDPYPANRLHAIRGLAHIGSDEAMEMLRNHAERAEHPAEKRLLDEVSGMH